MSLHRLRNALIALDEPARLRALRQLSEEERRELRYHWKLWARERQLPPPGDWTTWLILAGRGFGKTRAGAEWVRGVCQAQPGARLALVGASLGEVRAVMVEGESGILAVCAPGQIPVFEPSLRRLTWGNGAQATLYSAGEPESLRGPQHSHIWCDNLKKKSSSTRSHPESMLCCTRPSKEKRIRRPAPRAKVRAGWWEKRRWPSGRITADRSLHSKAATGRSAPRWSGCGCTTKRRAK